jgi:transposase-like protein
MKKQRKHYTPEEKVAILRRHLLEHLPISELCDKQGLQPFSHTRSSSAISQAQSSTPPI